MSESTVGESALAIEDDIFDRGCGGEVIVGRRGGGFKQLAVGESRQLRLSLSDLSSQSSRSLKIGHVPKTCLRLLTL